MSCLSLMEKYSDCGKCEYKQHHHAHFVSGAADPHRADIRGQDSHKTSDGASVVASAVIAPSCPHRLTHGMHVHGPGEAILVSRGWQHTVAIETALFINHK
jgi:hypothetical protein